jgi:hypothetical protein
MASGLCSRNTQVLADIMNVTLDSRKQVLAARGALGLLHELFQMGDSGFH